MPTVLVIDDEIIIQRLVTHTLQALRIKVISAMDAETALDIAVVTPVDMLLVDINLPDLDGFSLMARLKEIPALKDTPMVAFTARNDPDDEARALALGARGLIYKPFSTTELRDLVKSILQS